MTRSGAKFCWHARRASTQAFRSFRRRLPARVPARLVLACAGSAFASAAMYGQALPAATSNPGSTGFELPRVAGSMSYSVSAFESFTTGFYSTSGVDSGTGLSGNVALVTSSKSNPFSMVLSTGKSWSTSSGEPSPIYFDFAASQVLNFHKWNIVASDAVAYLPATPSAGLSGIPGTGDLGISPVDSGFYTGQGLLTAYSTRVSNTASLSIGRRVTSRVSLNATGSYGTLRFVGDSSGAGLDNSSYMGSGGLSYAIDARNTLNGNYSYSTFTYTGDIAGFSSQTASIGYSHQFSRLLSGDVFAGPQWTTISSQGVQLDPGATNFSGTAVNLFLSGDLNYGARLASYSLGYSHGTNNGFGVTPGGRSDSLHFSASKTFARVWSTSLTSAYTRTTSLSGAQSFSPSTFVVGVQVSRALARNLSAFGSYTLEKQSTNGATVGVFDLFSGSFQVASFGLTYSPRPLRFGAR